MWKSSVLCNLVSTASMVNSDSGYSTKSSFFDNTPSSTGQPELGEKDISSMWTQSNVTNTDSNSQQQQNHEEGDGWANFGGSNDQSKSPNNVTATKYAISGTVGGAKEEEDWGDFTQMSSDSSKTSLQNKTQSDASGSGNLWSGATVKSENWANFDGSAATADGGSIEGIMMVAADGSGGDGSQSGPNMVMIKKQNLGTNEIMGVFKVRDDPATLSGYQLPAKPTPSQQTSSR